MVKSVMIKFLVDEEQFIRIKKDASVNGFKTISSYLRDLCLNKCFRFENMIFEIHKEVVKNGRRE